MEKYKQEQETRGMWCTCLTCFIILSQKKKRENEANTKTGLRIFHN